MIYSAFFAQNSKDDHTLERSFLSTGFIFITIKWIVIKFGIAPKKLLGEFNYGLYQSNINSNLHEAEIELY
jgi:hypothetical protein